MSKYLRNFAQHTNYETFIAEEYAKPNVSYCIEENEIHYNPIYDPYNGYEYIDLGLPSGTLWAKMNVGAESETDYGLYFAWGETEGYTASRVPSDKEFSWSDYKFNPSGDGSTFTKYNASDGKMILDLEDDAAAANMGGDWHMPNRAQCVELFKETKNGFVTNAGAFTQYAWSDAKDYSNPTQTTATIDNWNTAGYFFFKSDVSDMDAAITSGDYLFIPAAGYCGDGEVVYVGLSGCVWASALNSGNVENAWNFYFDSGEAGVYNDVYRYEGQSVRGVIGNLIYIVKINNGVRQNSGITWDGDSTTISVTLSDAVTADNVQISMTQSNYNGVATATSTDGKTWTATINTKSGWSDFHGTTVRIWSDSFDYSANIQANIEN